MKAGLAVLMLAALAFGVVLVAPGSSLAPAPKLTPKQLAGKVKRAIKHEKAALKHLGKDRDATKSELDKSLRELKGAAASSRLDKSFDIATADLRQAINKDDIAKDNLDNKREQGRARAKINEAIVKKEDAVEIYERAAYPPPLLKPVHAEFDAGDFSTRYTVEATDPSGDTVEYAWTLIPPPDDPGCNNHGALKASTPAFTWEHGNEDGCAHKTPQHNGTVTVTVSDKHWDCPAAITGTVTHDGDPPGACDWKK